MNPWGIEEAERRRSMADGSDTLLRTLWREHPRIMRTLNKGKPWLIG